MFVDESRIKDMLMKAYEEGYRGCLELKEDVAQELTQEIKERPRCEEDKLKFSHTELSQLPQRVFARPEPTVNDNTVTTGSISGSWSGATTVTNSGLGSWNVQITDQVSTEPVTATNNLSGMPIPGIGSD